MTILLVTIGGIFAGFCILPLGERAHIRAHMRACADYSSVWFRFVPSLQNLVFLLVVSYLDLSSSMNHARWLEYYSVQLYNRYLTHQPPLTDDHRVERTETWGLLRAASRMRRSYNSVYFLSRGCQNLTWISDLNYRNQRREKKKKFHVYWMVEDVS